MMLYGGIFILIGFEIWIGGIAMLSSKCWRGMKVWAIVVGLAELALTIEILMAGI